MTPAQVTMTQIEFGKAWKARRAAGGGDQLNRETWRLSLKIRSGAIDRTGKPLSSKGMNNHHVDAFLALCLSYSQPANLAAQLALDEQPILRALHACAPLLDLLQMHEDKREAYLAGIYRNVQRKRIREEGAPELELRQITDDDLGRVLAALTHTVEHKLGVQHNHPRSGRGWQSRTDHRVGHRQAGQTLASQSPATSRRSSQNLEPQPFDQESPF